jgi:signal transduction histidine kinase
LVQLGAELVTDVEQAILECVKNAYDADAPGCSIEVRTVRTGTIEDQGTFANLKKFCAPAENVRTALFDDKGVSIDLDDRGRPLRELDDDAICTRQLSWTGSIAIRDEGEGLTEAQLRDSWLVISNSAKRPQSQGALKRKTTEYKRTPLGDKGLGRLGTMKLGDILEVKTATGPAEPVYGVHFRWADCESAFTVDEIPVRLRRLPNKSERKGTRVYVRGLKELEEWARPTRALEIARSLAKLISPFEAASTFPVTVDVDGVKQSLVAVTNVLLSRAIAEFHFDWRPAEKGSGYELVATARFREKLFRPMGSTKQRQKSDVVFEDGGAKFLQSLPMRGRLKRFKVDTKPATGWFIELTQVFTGVSIKPDSPLPVENPGPFTGSFYYFNLNELEGDDAVEVEAAAGLGIDRQMVKDMAGISILRDGFRVRSQGDWLKLSEAMTSGSTYNLRLHNTLGFFALSGERNSALKEKSDREGFVEDAAYRGFSAVAVACRRFANDALEEVRRAGDDFYKDALKGSGQSEPHTPDRSLAVVEQSVQHAAAAQGHASDLIGALQAGLSQIENQSRGRTPSAETVAVLRKALDKAKVVSKNLEGGPQAHNAVTLLRQEIVDNKDRALSLYESAAVGLSARGLAHELRTHLTEIRRRVANIETLIKSGKGTEVTLRPQIRSIRLSCSSIASSAALIDPLLPRTRSLREAIDLEAFIKEYAENRRLSLEREGISFEVVGPGAPVKVKFNRGRLLQVVDNLIRNSVYWLRRGHEVMGVKRQKAIRVEVLVDGFSVQDSGPGVDPAYEESIFEIFVSTKPSKDDGQGLGLFITTQLLEAEGCGVYLAPERNAEGRKAKFVVNLGPALM